MKIEEIILESNANVYIPDEDTFSLATALDRWFDELQPMHRLKILEVGCGSGFLVIRLAKKNPHHIYFATDVSWEACIQADRNARINGVTVHISCQNLTKGFLTHDQWCGFDLVFFNPPYLPSNKLEGLSSPLDLATLGGHHGIEIMEQFLQHVPQVLSENGHVLLLTTNWNPQEQLLAIARQYFCEIIPYYQRKVLSERHVVYLLKR